MHECPACGQACDCDGEDVWNDAAAEECTHACEEEDDAPDQYSVRLDYCVDCGSPKISTMCQCCGGWLCNRHAETGAGFCKQCPTQEWIDKQTEEG